MCGRLAMQEIGEKRRNDGNRNTHSAAAAYRARRSWRSQCYHSTNTWRHPLGALRRSAHHALAINDSAAKVGPPGSLFRVIVGKCTPSGSDTTGGAMQPTQRLSGVFSPVITPFAKDLTP